MCCRIGEYVSQQLFYFENRLLKPVLVNIYIFVNIDSTQTVGSDEIESSHQQSSESGLT